MAAADYEQDWLRKNIEQATATAPHYYPITPNNDEDLPWFVRGIIINEEGAIHVKTMWDEEVTIPDGLLAPNMIHTLGVKRVYAAGTTVTTIWGVV